jgi:2-hydroxy-4-carboxymuconate semialdehyde hemiacetal dehydrogenase
MPSAGRRGEGGAAMKICLAGEGAQGVAHMEALRHIEGVEVATLAGGIERDAAAFAAAWGIPHYALDLGECLRQPGVEAVILGTPNPLHAAQIELALGMGKHVLVEIPMGLTLAESERVAALEERTGLVCMVCHTFRYSNLYRELRRRIGAGEFTPHHIVHQTYFFRRRNENRFGKPRTWVDDLLWHQACHMVDLVCWLLDDPDLEAWGQSGPPHPRLGIPMDLTIGLRSRTGCLVTSAHSFNHHGPIQVQYRFIGEQATLVADKGKLVDHEGNEIPVADGGGTAAQDREFFAAIGEGRKALTSCAACLPVMAILDRIQRAIDAPR